MSSLTPRKHSFAGQVATIFRYLSEQTHNQAPELPADIDYIQASPWNSSSTLSTETTD